MREIKFRGKTLSGKWVYGYAAKFAHDSVSVTTIASKLPIPSMSIQIFAR